MSKLFFFVFINLVIGSTKLFGFELKTQSKAVVLIDSKTGKILFEKNAHTLLPPASTTKVATVCYALNKLQGKDLSQLLDAPAEVLQTVTKSYKKKVSYKCPAYLLEPDGTSLEIKKNEKLPISTLLYGTMMASANDGANVLAYHLGSKKIDNFMAGLNKFIKDLGCQKTKFSNPHGLHHPEHSTTAYELALITREAMKDQLFRKLVSTPMCVRPKTNKSEEKLFYQPNRLLLEGNFYYPQALGVKTGYTEDAGYCLVACAKDLNRDLIAVILGSPTYQDRYADAIELFNQAFSEVKKKQKIYSKKDAVFKYTHPKASKTIALNILKDIDIEYYASLKPKINTEVTYNPISPPFSKGQVLGVLSIYLEEEKYDDYDLVCLENIQLKSYLRFKENLKDNFLIWIVSFFCVNFFFYLAFKQRKYFERLFIR